MRYDLIYYKYRCIRCRGDIITLVKEDDGLILRDEPIACPRCDSIFVALKNLRESTKRLPLEERLYLFSKLLDLMNYKLSDVNPYIELYHLLTYYLQETREEETAE
jgi:DNA-directed RNA polymerase subunit RPC12/RpoP